MPEPYRTDIHTLRAPGRATLLYLLATPLIPAILAALAFGDLERLLVHGGAFALLLTGATFMRRGLRAEAEFNRRKIATAPRTPHKLLGGLLTAAGTFVCSWLAAGNSIAFAAAIGAAAFGATLLAYGGDVRGRKDGNLGGHGYTTEEIVAALTEAETRIAGIESARGAIGNPELAQRLRSIAQRARQILAVIEEDPGDLRRARKFLNVYLDGAQRVTEGYARAHRHGQVSELEDNFRNVLSTIEEVFTEQHQKLLDDDALDLDVQIEVLATQLKREGVV